MPSRNYTTVVKSVEVTGKDGRLQRLSLGTGLILLCGGNGAGKSTMLGALWRCLSSEEFGPPALPPVPPWLTTVQVGGSHVHQEWSTSYNVETSQFSGVCPTEVHYLDPSASTEDIIRLVREDDNPADLLAGIDPAQLHPELVDILSMTLRRRYDEISVFEVTSFSEDDDPVPIFSASAMGTKYDLRMMGRGELSAIYLVWSLSRIEPGSVVLIEEPECHLADYSQRHLLEALAYFAVERDLTLVISSHSPGIIQPLPQNNVVYLTGLPVPGLIGGLSIDQLTEQLGLEKPGTRTLVVVEDQSAAAFLEAMINYLDRPLLQHLAIAYTSNGASGVERIMSELRQHIRPPRFKVVAVLDGDMRTPSGVSPNPDTSFLPGFSAPEVIMREALDEWRRDIERSWQPSFPGGSSALELELSKVDGLDHHDWIHGVGSKYGGIRNFATVITELVLIDSTRREEGQTLVGWLRGSL